MTIASLADLGYTVDLAAAEPYALPPASVRSSASGAPGLRIGEKLLDLPTRTVDADGTVSPAPVVP